MKRTCADAYMDDRTAVLLARADCRNDPVALQVCDMFLKMFPEPPPLMPVELTLPSRDKD